MTSSTYHGRRSGADPDTTSPTRVQVTTSTEQGEVTRGLRHVVLHSPTGLNWGYPGSGPADLALSILADHLGEQPTRKQLNAGQSLAWMLHQKFKRQFVQHFDHAWSLTGEVIDAWLASPEVAAIVNNYRRCEDEVNGRT